MSPTALLAIEVDTPRLQQLEELRRGPAARGHAHRAHAAAHLRHRIDDGQDLAAAKHVLVDGVGSLRRELVGLGNHQHINVGRDLLDVLRLGS